MSSNPQFTHGSVRQRLELALTHEMRDGEQVAWQGMKLARIEPKGFAIWLFAIPWTAFSLFWTAMASLATVATDDSVGILGWAFPLFGTPFILIGLGMLAMPFVPYFQRGRILFAVTNQRVLQLEMGRDLTVKSIPSSRIGDIVRRESGDGTGSVEIALSGAIMGVNGRRTTEMTLGRVDDIRGAYAAVLELSQRD
ncbi:MAG: hypothetical protein ACMUJI_05250 [Erythrobacter sp.]|jgi:hypothetical protein|uniref:hypothetical protein n=1 Tax=Erythrobacter sp. TaxID=1042 RepID=UPI003A8AC075